jgi:hypothetical protein
MNNAINWLKGKKTYIVAGIGVVFAVAEYWAGALNVTDAAYAILGSLGLGTLRSGVNSTIEKVLEAVLETAKSKAPVAPANAAEVVKVAETVITAAESTVK